MDTRAEQLMARLNSLVSIGGMSRFEEVEFAEGKLELALLWDQQIRLSAGDHFMGAAKRREQVRLENPISAP